MNEESWEGFLTSMFEPINLEVETLNIKRFLSYAQEKNNTVALITSGGTIVPIENNTMAFIDSFSGGSRGAASAEYFLKLDYYVIFLHRKSSAMPFSRKFNAHSLLNSLAIIKDENHEDCLSVDLHVVPIIDKVYKDNQHYKERLLFISFTTVQDYCFLLKTCASLLQPLKTKALIYLAAAVNDYYIPSDKMVNHETTEDGSLALIMNFVPNLLKPTCCEWAKEAFVISYKLETEEQKMLEKSKETLKKFGHKIVITTTFQTKKQKVLIVSDDKQIEIKLSQNEILDGVEIDEKIIEEINIRHKQMMSGEEDSPH